MWKRKPTPDALRRNANTCLTNCVFPAMFRLPRVLHLGAHHVLSQGSGKIPVRVKQQFCTITDKTPMRTRVIISTALESNLEEKMKHFKIQAEMR
ncbi:hypothetical protein E2C01_003855 [Portunus trituberculatus]|uniref:Uncharacterized protein n=1 Tax=Portunus trituberculatus TaxID=210409 RepID=A0A5B7CRA5_PORTR|nr:hypothetical protein [Portunus trituberculatus]